MTVGKNFAYNQFALSNNNATDDTDYGNVAVKLGAGSAVGVASIGGRVNNNIITIEDGIGNMHENVGFQIKVFSPSTFTFSKEVTQNTITITGGSSSTNYGFDLNPTQTGTINFNGNTEEQQLAELNGNTSVQLGGGMINFNG